MNITGEQAAKLIAQMESHSRYVADLTNEAKAETARRIVTIDVGYEQALAAVNETGLGRRGGQAIPTAADFLSAIRNCRPEQPKSDPLNRSPRSVDITEPGSAYMSPDHPLALFERDPHGAVERYPFLVRPWTNPANGMQHARYVDARRHVSAMNAHRSRRTGGPLPHHHQTKPRDIREFLENGADQ